MTSGHDDTIAARATDALFLGLMRTTLNLSSRPFANHRLFWIAAAAMLIVSLWAGLWLSAEKDAAAQSTAKLEGLIKSSKEEFERLVLLEEEQRKAEQSAALTPQESTELAAARVIVLQKSFSIDRVLSDLEPYVPPDTRLMGVKVDSVGVMPDRSAVVAVSALGKTAEQLTVMLKKLDESDGVFVTGDASQGQQTETGEVPFSIAMTYKPKGRASE
jgi:hypothetical protein